MVTQTKTARISKAASNYLSSLWARREFAWYMAMGNLRSRNASTALGLFWWVLNPVLMALVYYIVFGVILDVSRDLSQLLSGVFVFYYTSTSISTGANAIIQNKALLVNLQFPRLIMPITAVIETGIGFLVSIPAFYLIVGVVDGIWPGRWFIVLFPIAFVLQTAFNLGLASLTARVAVPFRDVSNLIPHLTRIWLYLSPILFTVDQYDKLPETAQVIVQLNPMVPLLSVYRTALLGTPFEMSALVQSTIWGLGLAVVAVTVFVRYEGKMARYL